MPLKPVHNMSLGLATQHVEASSDYSFVNSQQQILRVARIDLDFNSNNSLATIAWFLALSSRSHMS